MYPAEVERWFFKAGIEGWHISPSHRRNVFWLVLRLTQKRLNFVGRLQVHIQAQRRRVPQHNKHAA